MTSVSQAIVDAFERVSSHAPYCEKWISARDWAFILCKEYDLPIDIVGELLFSHLNSSDKQDAHSFKGVNGIYAKTVDASPQVATRFLFVGPNVPKDDSPYYVPKEKETTKHCPNTVISPQIRFQLLSVLVPEIEKQRGMTTTTTTTASEENNSNPKKRPAPSGYPVVIPRAMPPMNMLPPAARMIPPRVSPPSKFSLSDKTISKRAKDMQAILGDTDEATKTQIVRMLLKKKGMDGIKETLAKEMTSPVEGAICNGIRDFFAHHESKGSRAKHEQDAMDAVMTAVCFAPKGANMTKMGQRLGVPTTKQLTAFRGRVKEMKSTGAKFQPKTRKKRSDCWREDAIKCVMDYIHSDEVSHADTRTKARVYKIKGSQHPARLWNVSGGSNASRFRSFLESQAYADFQASGRTISMEIFRLAQCNCIKEPPEEAQSLSVGQSDLYE